MKDENYIVIQGWMVNQLKLSGNELMVYAIIYGFSQDKESRFKGSAKYIADSLCITRQAVLTNLKLLINKGFIKKYERNERGIKWCDYEAAREFLPKEINEACKESLHPVKKIDRVCKESLQAPCKESLHHNTNIDNIKINTGGSLEPPASFSQALELSTLLLTSHRKEFPDYLSGKNTKKVIEQWAEDIEKLIRIDKKQPEIIQQVILWAKTPGNFWFPNIQSGDKLRKQFEILYSQMITELKRIDPPERKSYVPNAEETDKMLAELEKSREQEVSGGLLSDELKKIARKQGRL
jgi:DNA-binding MarR family transcriptional regulator